MNTVQTPLIRQGWIRALLYIIAIFFGAVLMQLFAIFITNSLAIEKGNEETGKLQNLLITTAISSISIFSVTLFFRRFFDRKSLVSLGFNWKGFTNEAVLGFFTGPALLGIGTILLAVAGYLTFIGFTLNALPLLIEFLLLILVAFTEELLFRGYLLNNLMQSTNKWVALLISAIIFALFHALNPGVSILAIANVLVAGLLLGINYIYTKNLWFGIFFHLSWNFFQGPVLGYDVSGLDFQSIFQQTLSGSALFTGGTFGFEGSLLCLLLLILALTYFAYLFYKMYKPALKPV